MSDVCRYFTAVCFTLLPSHMLSVSATTAQYQTILMFIRQLHFLYRQFDVLNSELRINNGTYGLAHAACA